MSLAALSPLKPDDHDAQFMLEEALRDKGRVDAQNAVLKHPEDAQAHATLAHVLFWQTLSGETSGISEYRKAIAIAPSDPRFIWAWASRSALRAGRIVTKRFLNCGRLLPSSLI